jgi:transposase InsO family protein
MRHFVAERKNTRVNSMHMSKHARPWRKSSALRFEAKANVFDYVELIYNPHRRLSTSGYISPLAFEQKAGLTYVRIR